MTATLHLVTVYFAGDQSSLVLNLTDEELGNLLSVASQQSGVFYTQQGEAREYLYGRHIQRIQDNSGGAVELAYANADVEIGDLTDIPPASS